MVLLALIAFLPKGRGGVVGGQGVNQLQGSTPATWAVGFLGS